MKLRNLNFILKFILQLFYISAILLLIFPWINLFLTQLAETNLNSQHILWFYMFSFSLAMIMYLKRKISFKILNLFLIISVLAFFLIIILSLDWFFPVFLLFYLICITGTIIYLKHEENHPYLKDIFLGTGFLIVNLLLENVHDFNFSLNIIILYFILCFGFLLINNLNLSLKKGNKISGYLFIYTIAYFLFAVIITLIPASFIVEEGLLEIVSSFLSRGYYYFTTGILYVIYPLARVLFWLISFIPVSDDSVVPPGEGSGNQFFQEQQVEQVDEYLLENPMIQSIIQLIIFVLVVYFVYKKFFYQNNSLSLEEGIEEERESIFDRNKIKNNIAGIWKNVKGKVINKDKFSYQENIPEQKVRKIYSHFIGLYQPLYEYKVFYTPFEYQKMIQNGDKIKEIKHLTELYNLARYKEKINPNQVKQAEKYWQKIKQNNNSN